MKRVSFTLFVLMGAGITTGHAAEGSATALDTSGVTAVAISGEASAVAITTQADQAYQATIRHHRDGWLARWSSGWIYDDCSGSGRMWIDGALLHVDVGQSSWFSTSDCRYDISLNLPRQTAVVIRQQALKADLSGEFGAVTIDAEAADIAVTGHADSLLLQGDAMRVGLSFSRSDRNEALTINARMLQADLDFSAIPALAYSVTAKAAFVDSRRESSLGAKPSLTISGDFVHATIR